jgi:predicted dienelactone hydrolase
MTDVTLLARCFAFLLICCGLLPATAMASEPGWRSYTVPASGSASDAIAVALYYPTQAPARAIAMGPFTVRVAIQAPPEARVKGLIILSHGTGGSELGHSSLAEALARNGYLVAAMRHPGDNWQDRSLWQKPPGAFFIERPRQISRVIDALLADPDWKDRIATDARGPRIGALGHSAGGYTVVALVGGQVDLSRITDHCRANRADDPILCAMGRTDQASSPEPLLSPTADTRVRAVVAMAPLGVMFTPASLAAIRTPMTIYAAELDRWLVPRFHADWIAQNVPDAAFHRVSNAWHFAFMDRPGAPIPTPDGDAAADPPGFDRAALLARLAVELPAFFDKALAQ